MSEHDELVKSLRELLTAQYERGVFDEQVVSMSRDQWSRICAERDEAAQAIERLERSVKAEKNGNVLLRKDRDDREAHRLEQERELADARAEIERLRPALTGLLDAVDRKDMDSVDCRHFRPYQDKAREALATPATHPFREVNPVIDKCGECGEHPDHPIHNPAPAPEPTTSEAERRVVEALAPCFDRTLGRASPMEITANIPARLWNKVRDSYHALAGPAPERQYYRSCGNCKWQRDTDEDDRYEGRCPKCGGATLQWAKPPSSSTAGERRMIDLIQELEQAQEGSRELSNKALLAAGWVQSSDMNWLRPDNVIVNAAALPSPTENLQDALGLVLEGWNTGIYQNDDGTWYADLREGYRTSYDRVCASPLKTPTPALALTIAAIKASQVSGEDKE